MRFVMYGAGAVGGVVGARLHQHGHEVVLIARGAHLEAIREGGLTLRTPNEDVVLNIPVAETPADVDWRPDDVVLLAMKSQDTAPALDALREAAGDELPVICCQNGVVNERMTLRRFANVYGMAVMLPATHLEPGVVQADSRLATGILDTGRYPAGRVAVAEEVCAALAASTFSAVPRENVMDWKYAKLLWNLHNATEAICGSGERAPDLTELMVAEGQACYRAAGISWIEPEEYAARRKGLIEVTPTAISGRAGNSSWQSLARGRRSIEADYLNGEIVLLSRLYGVPTPANAVLQRVANRVAREGLEPGAIGVEELRAEVLRATGDGERGTGNRD